MPYNMETLTQELVPRLCDELKRKPHGKPQSKDDRNFAFDTAGPLLRGYLARCRAALIQKQAEAGRLHQILKQTEIGETPGAGWQNIAAMTGTRLLAMPGKII